MADVVASCSKNRKSVVKAPSYNWTDNQTIILMHVLKEFHSKFGFNKTYDWAVVNKGFLKRTRVDLTKHGKTVARNKVEHMKKLWRIWSDLQFKVTGAGWDRDTGMVTLPGECWESFKNSDNSKYLHFRTKGVDPELCALWDEVFGTIMATGKNVMAPGILKNTPAQLTDEPIFDLTIDRGDELLHHNATELDSLLDRDLLDDDEAQHELLSRVRTDVPFEECLDSVYDTLTTPLTTGSDPSGKKNVSNGKRKKDCSILQEKLTKKHKYASTSFNEHMKLVSHTGKKMLSIMEGECESTIHGNVVVRQYQFNECFEVVEKMVEEKLLRDQSKLWCYAVTKFGNQESRNQFMQLKRNDARLTWLKYEYENTYKLYDHIDVLGL